MVLFHFHPQEMTWGNFREPEIVAQCSIFKLRNIFENCRDFLINELPTCPQLSLFKDQTHDVEKG